MAVEDKKSPRPQVEGIEVAEAGIEPATFRLSGVRKTAGQPIFFYHHAFRVRSPQFLTMIVRSSSGGQPGRSSQRMPIARHCGTT
jgi:hypothetical protein